MRSTIRTVLTGLMVAAISTAFAQTAAYEPGKLLVTMKPGYEGQAQSVAIQLGARVTSVIPKLNVAVIRCHPNVTSGMWLRFKRHSMVRSVDYNYYRYSQVVPNDPDYPKQWGPKMVGAEAAWDISTGRTSSIIAILDTGVDLSHPEFAGRLLPGYDFADNDNDPNDVGGHGTHVAGIAAATGNNGIGVAGMSWGSRILPVRVLGPAGGTLEMIINGIVYAADQGANVISMSLGGYGRAQVEEDAIEYAHSKGALSIAAAGNDNTDMVSYPAGFEKVISVGATNQSDQKAGFSNYGPTVDVAAPGEGIFSTYPGTYGYADGTSMACPMVSGLAGLVFSQARPGTTNDQVRKLIEDNCRPMPPGFVQIGRIDAEETMKKIPRPVGSTVLLSTIVKHSGGSISGNVVSARFADGAMYAVQSTPHAALGALNGAVLNFTLPANIPTANIAEVSLSLRQRGALRVTNMVYAWNYQTGRYDLVRSFPMSNSVRTDVLRFQTPSPYLSGSRQMRFLTRGLLPKRLQTPTQSSFTLSIDEAKLGLSLTN